MRRLLFALFGACILIGLIGSRWIPLWTYVFGGASPMWKDVVSWIQAFDRWLIELGMFPSMIAIGIVGLILTYEAPRIWAAVRKYDIEYTAFLQNRNSGEQANARIDFYNLLARAYHEWKSNWPVPLPEKVELFIDSAPLPVWILDHQPSSGTFLGWAKRHADETHPHWAFVRQLYREIELYQKRRDENSIKLLTPPDAEELHKVCRTLSRFWEITAEKVFTTRRLRLNDLEPHLPHDRRLILALVYLSVALFIENEQEGEGPRDLYRLSCQLKKNPQHF